MLVPERLKALIVDDNAYARAATAATLRKLGLVHITECETGADALNALLAQKHDVMFMDWYMPEMSGGALMATIRDSRFGPNGALPVVLMTAYASRENLTKAKELGVNEILTKPFATNHVSAALTRVLAGWDMPVEAPVRKAAGDDQIFL